jgi:uncharacterized membrane protein YdbT with pleckstrin-like domain
VPFPEDVLTEDEDVVLHLHPHAKAAVLPTLLLLVALAAAIVTWVMLPPNTGGLIGVWVVGLIALYVGLRYGVRPLLVWRCTHYVFTEERILVQDGVIARQRRDLPLGRVNDHLMRQSVLERVFGCGTLTIDSVGDEPVVLTAVPRVQRVQTLLYELIELAPADDKDYNDDKNDKDDEEPDEAIDVPLVGRPAPPQARRRGPARR